MHTRANTATEMDETPNRQRFYVRENCPYVTGSTNPSKAEIESGEQALAGGFL